MRILAATLVLVALSAIPVSAQCVDGTCRAPLIKAAIVWAPMRSVATRVRFHQVRRVERRMGRRMVRRIRWRTRRGYCG